MKRPTSSNLLSGFFAHIIDYPGMNYRTTGISYTASAETSERGTFIIGVDGAVEIGGIYFRNQQMLDEYLISLKIAIKGSLVNFDLINTMGRRGSILLLEKIWYRQTPALLASTIAKVKGMLRVSVNFTGSMAVDDQFLSIKKGMLVHERTKDVITPEEWVPLYRPGSIFGIPDETVPINLESYEHVIF